MTALTALTTLGGVASRLEQGEAEGVVAWAAQRFGSSLALAASFQDSVLIDIVSRVAPSTEVVFLDTGFHFPETLDYVEHVRQRYDLRLTVVAPEVSPERYPCGAARCCEVRKVRPLRKALAGKGAWMTGLRRVEAPTRAATPVVAWDDRFGLYKVCPLATWTDEDVEDYTRRRHLAIHPLQAFGYTSIGCAPTTAPPVDRGDARSGRWAGTGKTECGLHLAD